MGKLLDITEKLKSKREIHTDSSAEPIELTIPEKLQTLSSEMPDLNGHANSPTEVGSSTIYDLQASRQEMIQRDRREAKRTLLSNIIGAFAVLPERGLLKITIYDISDTGMAFDTDLQEGFFNSGDEVAMRIYINHKLYFSFQVKVLNGRKYEKEGIVRHGAYLMKNPATDVALHHFVKFIENVASNLLTDDGDFTISHIS